MTSYEVIVVGGGAAGLSAALQLGRAGRRTLVVDSGRQSNLPAHAIGGLLGHDGLAPSELYAKGCTELRKYPSVQVRDAEVLGARTGFVVTLAGGEELHADRVLLALGMDYELPALPGIEPLWGDTVFHCPFCHGWEVRGRPLAVLGRDPAAAVHQGRMLKGWSDDVVVLSDGPAAFDTTGLVVDERPVAGLRAQAGKLAAITFGDGSPELERAGLLLAAPLRQRSGLAEQLGAALTEQGTVEVDERGFTTVPGLAAAGDVAVAPPSIARAIASGQMAGAMLAVDLLL